MKSTFCIGDLSKKCINRFMLPFVDQTKLPVTANEHLEHCYYKPFQRVPVNMEHYIN